MSRKGDPGVFGQIRINLTLLLILSVTYLTAVFLYWKFASYQETMSFASALIAGFAAVYAAYYAREAMGISARRARQQRSFEMLDRLNEIKFVELRRELQRAIQQPKISSE